MGTSTKSRPQQPTLKGYKPTALEIAAAALLLAKEALEEAKDNVDKNGAAMIDAMKANGRTSLTLEGYTISVNTTPSREKLMVKKAEQR